MRLRAKHLALLLLQARGRVQPSWWCLLVCVYIYIYIDIYVYVGVCAHVGVPCWRSLRAEEAVRRQADGEEQTTISSP